MKVKHLIKGVVKSLPGIDIVYNFHQNTGGTDSVRYCYSVWLRHLVLAYENGYKKIPERVAELGPGDSLGIGLSALLSGAEKYYALDIIKYTNSRMNLEIFEGLVNLFRNKTPIPLESEFPNIKPALKNYVFPKQIFTDEYLERMLDENRLNRIRKSIKSIDTSGESEPENMICYKAPWNDDKIIEPESVDMIISQAVLQHVDDLKPTYEAMNKWLKRSGLVSHSIDFKSMGSSDSWYGHWTYSDLEWKIVKGRKKYLINREPYSTHVQLIKNNGLNIINEMKVISAPPKRNLLAKKFRNLSQIDLSVSGLFIQARKEISLFIAHCYLYFFETSVLFENQAGITMA